MSMTDKADDQERIYFNKGEVQETLKGFILFSHQPHVEYVRVDRPHQEALDVSALKREVTKAFDKYEQGASQYALSAIEWAIDHLANRLNTPNPESGAALEAFEEYCSTLFYVANEQARYRLRGEWHDNCAEATLQKAKERAKKAYEGLEPHIDTIKARLTHPAPKDTLETLPADWHISWLGKDDGGWTCQITRHGDLEYLPDNEITFVSTRGYTAAEAIQAALRKIGETND